MIWEIRLMIVLDYLILLIKKLISILIHLIRKSYSIQTLIILMTKHQNLIFLKKIWNLITHKNFQIKIVFKVFQQNKMMVQKLNLLKVKKQTNLIKTMIWTKSLWLKFLIFNLKSLHSKIFQIVIKNQMNLKIDLKKIFI